MLKRFAFLSVFKTISRVSRMTEVVLTASEQVTNNTSPVKRPLSADNEVNDEANVPDSKKSKLDEEVPPPMQGRLDRKRKVALLLAYCGAGYYGVQIQKDFPTIESELLSSLVKGNFITQENADSPQKIQFQRAARTDKGVSATCNVISLKMSLHPDDVLQAINENLPEQIRVISYMRVTRGFNSKNFCDSRTYKYMMPTYAFAGVETYITDEFRINDETLTKLQEVLNMYKGTHNFHNFTSGVKPTEACAQRYIISFEAEKPVVVDGIEFITLTVKGQSFMLHHIRKMVALAISALRGVCGVEAITRSFSHDKMDVPKAPSEGLFLYQTHYDGYNKRYGSDGIHDPIDWTHCQAEIVEFTKQYITSHIVKTEKNDRIVLQWLKVLPLHKFDTRDDNEHRSARETLGMLKKAELEHEKSVNETSDLGEEVDKVESVDSEVKVKLCDNSDEVSSLTNVPSDNNVDCTDVQSVSNTTDKDL